MSNSRSDIQSGILMMVIAMLVAPGMDAIAKWLAGSIEAGEVVFFRFVIQALLLMPFLIWRGGFNEGTRLWAHALRGFLVALAVTLFFASLKEMPLADAIAIFFLEPLILTILSAVILKEKVGWRRILAVSIGFAGALLIIQPSYALFGATALLPVGAAISFAFYMVLSRRLVIGGSAITMQFYTGIFGALTMGVGLILGAELNIPALRFQWPTLNEWILLGLIGVLATGTHLLIVLAIRRVGAGIVAPFQYVEIIAATALGFIFFNEFPDAITWLGISIIIGSGFYVFIRERQIAGN